MHGLTLMPPGKVNSATKSGPVPFTGKEGHAETGCFTPTTFSPTTLLTACNEFFAGRLPDGSCWPHPCFPRRLRHPLRHQGAADHAVKALTKCNIRFDLKISSVDIPVSKSFVSSCVIQLWAATKERKTDNEDINGLGQEEGRESKASDSAQDQRVSFLCSLSVHCSIHSFLVLPFLRGTTAFPAEPLPLRSIFLCCDSGSDVSCLTGLSCG